MSEERTTHIESSFFYMTAGKPSYGCHQSFCVLDFNHEGDCMSRNYPVAREQLDDMKRKGNAPSGFRFVMSEARRAASSTPEDDAGAVTFESIDGESQTHQMVLRNLSMLIRRLAYRHPNRKLAEQAHKYLEGEGLQGNILRAASSNTATPAPHERYPGPWKCVPYSDRQWEVMGPKEMHICFVENTTEGREKGRLIAQLAAVRAATEAAVLEAAAGVLDCEVKKHLAEDEPEKYCQRWGCRCYGYDELEDLRDRIRALRETTKPEMGVCGICETPHKRFDSCLGWRSTSGKTAKTPSTPKA
jgi:hypothetical protein